MTISHDARPWMTALEMQFAALGIVRKLARMPDVPHSVTDAHVLRELATAAPFAWSRDTTQAAWLASKSIPETARFDRDLLPEGLRSAFWWLEYPLPLPTKTPANWSSGESDDLDLKHICALLLSRDAAGVWTLSCGRMSSIGAPFMIEVNQIAADCSLRELVAPEAPYLNAQTGKLEPIRDRDIALFRFVMAASAWLKQRIVSIDSGHIERHRRKQLAREFDADVRDVKVIALRRLESQSGQTDAEDVEWSCRWIVSGHWRNQIYAGGEHKLIYILPYVKGPDDKPLKVPTHTVYSVNR